MKFIETTDKSTGEEIKLSYGDYGKGQPIVLIHGWPSSKEMWEYQINDLVNAGFRVVKYDRRGFGKSSKPWDGYDYDTFADDLSAVIEKLDLKDAVLVGFSMGGGEVARYLSKHGSNRIAKAVLVSSVLPYLQKASDNEDGVSRDVFEDMLKQIKEDRIGFLEGFGKSFFGVNLINKPVSAAYLDYFRNLASVASARSTQEAAKAFAGTDFRQDLKSFDIPTLIIHGTSDKIVPIQASSDLTAKLIPDAIYKKYEGAPHGLFFTEKEQFNQHLIDFISTGALQANSWDQEAAVPVSGQDI